MRDVVIESSRPRALEQLGLDAATVMTGERACVWIRITGHGRDQPNRVALGDDAAVAGGLVAVDADGPVFVGDAIADPLTGALAALLAAAGIGSGSSWVVDLSMAGSPRPAWDSAGPGQASFASASKTSSPAMMVARTWISPSWVSATA